MKVFVTGGAGFIGSHLCRRFLQDGHDVVAFDNLILGRREFLKEFESNPHFRFVEADLVDLARVKQEMKGCDLVVHMAANSDISQGAARTDVDMNNGTIATYNTLEAMRVNEVKQLIFASTSAIYGEADVKPTPEGYGPLFPISFYGASKLACEAMVSAFSHNCGIKAWVYRFANIVGTPSTHGAIHDFVSRLIKSPKALEVLGNGTQRKSYLHVDDCVDGMLFGYKKSQEAFQCFNLASRGVSNVRFIAEEVVRQMTPVLGQQATLKFGEGDRGWVGDVPYTYLDGSKLESLGWKARLESDEAVRAAIGEIISIRTGKSA
ncbi:MAG TPA: NAD-dependent epimerase/dehydratase family protein [Bdellovibrionales bacterium]|nr:NAD-dependent epimerase/dehydratase family protein [Bdellovibrionales bacterium]